MWGSSEGGLLPDYGLSLNPLINSVFNEKNRSTNRYKAIVSINHRRFCIMIQIMIIKES